MKTKITVRPVQGLTGAEEWFWMVTRDGRLLDSGMTDTEGEALFAASDRAAIEMNTE